MELGMNSKGEIVDDEEEEGEVEGVEVDVSTPCIMHKDSDDLSFNPNGKNGRGN